MKKRVKLSEDLEANYGHLDGDERLRLAQQLEAWAGELRTSAAAMGAAACPWLDMPEISRSAARLN